MEYHFEKYQKKHLDACARIIRATWPFEKDLLNPKKPEELYRYYMRDCENWSEHLDLIVDEEGCAKGILFGSIERAPLRLRIKYLLKNVRNRAGIWFHILNGDLGERRAAAAALRSMKEFNRLGEMNEEGFESEVNLFILSPDLRGMGFGKQLMDRYVAFCKRNRLKTAFLWTTPECTYTFYEKYGFEMLKRFRVELPHVEKPDAMVYFLNIA